VDPIQAGCELKETVVQQQRMEMLDDLRNPSVQVETLANRNHHQKLLTIISF